LVLAGLHNDLSHRWRDIIGSSLEFFGKGVIVGRQWAFQRAQGRSRSHKSMKKSDFEC
jgi:hypothetical protein